MTNDENVTELYNKFVEITQNGTEEDAKKFLTENFNSFPEDLQESITMGFFQEALANASEEQEAVMEVEKQGIEALTALGKAKKALEDKIKVIDLQDSMKS